MAIDAARAKSLFLAASDLADPANRAAFLERECDGDAELRGRVEALLDVNDASPLSPVSAEEEVMNTHIEDCHPRMEVCVEPAARIGSILGGKYKLIEEIGEGGMGSVYLAQQTEPVKRAVAVKVIKEGMDSRAVLIRFEAERQALAMMDHPNIARVLDAGTTDGGRPYFVMELVKGMPITQYCDEYKLTTRQRLELFVPVCQAIQHAHQKGVIHRDIKPSNVLIAMYDDKPVPKVIDFGVAKATGQSLTDMTLMTGFGAVVGTPEYMSPEQANLNNMDIDTRSDVYSLGVLLYELLTGSTPVDRKTLGKAALLEVLRIVREVDAPKPSHKLSTSDALPSVAASRGTEPAKLSKLMKGELDWVVLKALEKDRTRRYDSANGLAADVQRYLADELVEARPPSTSYRIRKLVRRNKGQVLAASLVLLVLIAGMVGTSIGLMRAQEQRRIAVAAQLAAADRAEGERQAKQKAEDEAKKARKQAQIAEAVKDFLERDLIAQANPLDASGDNKPDPDLKLKTALDRAVTHIAKRFDGKPLVEASIRRAIGKAYAGRGLIPEAQAQLEIACELYGVELTLTDHTNVETLIREPYIEALLDLVNFHVAQGQTQKALAAIQTMQNQVRQMYGDGQEVQSILESASGIRDVIEGKDATQVIKRNHDNLQKMLDTKSSEHKSPGQKAETKGQDAKHGVMTAFQQMESFTAALKLINQGKLPEAELVLTQLIESRRGKDGAQGPLWMSRLADVYRLQGKFAEARASFETSRDGIKKALGEDHPGLGACDYGLALTLLSEKEYDLAEMESRTALEFYEKHNPKDLIRFEIMSMVGAALMGQKKYSAAEPLFLAAYDGLKPQDETIPVARRSLILTTVDRLVELYTVTNQPDELAKWKSMRETYPEVAPPQEQK